METIIPYNNTSASSTWSTTTDIQMKELDFYSEIPVTVDGVKVTVHVKWSSDDYVYNVPGTYYYTTTANGYTFAEGVEAKIAVKVVEGVLNAKDTGSNPYIGSISADATNFNFVINGNALYDSTGCNKLSDIAASKICLAAGIRPGGTGHSSSKTYPNPTTGLQSISVMNSPASRIYAGNVASDKNPVMHNGDRYVYINGFNGEFIAGGGVYTNAGKTVTETGNTTIDITGKIVITTGIYSAGWSAASASISNTSSNGTVTVNIFELENGSSIPLIKKVSLTVRVPTAVHS